MVGPWAHNLMVLGSNPIMVKVFFVHSILIDRLRDSLNIKFRKALGTAARAQISNWGQLMNISSEPTYLYITLFSTLTAGKSETSCATETFSTSFERSDQWLSGARSSRAWKYFYLLSHPFEKSHFTPQKA